MIKRNEISSVVIFPLKKTETKNTLRGFARLIANEVHYGGMRVFTDKDGKDFVTTPDTKEYNDLSEEEINLFKEQVLAEWALIENQ